MNDVGSQLAMLGNSPKSASGKQETYSNRSVRTTGESSDRFNQSIEAEQANHVPAFAQWLQKIEADDLAMTKKSASIERVTRPNDFVTDNEIEELVETILSLDPHLVSEYLDAHELTSLIMSFSNHAVEGGQEDPFLNQRSSNMAVDQTINNQQGKIQWPQLRVFPGYYPQVAMVSSEGNVNNDSKQDQDIEFEIEQLQKAERLSKNLNGQSTISKIEDAYQSISGQVESFLKGEGNVTLSSILAEVRQVVNPGKTTYDFPQKELETTADLEKLLQQLKSSDKQAKIVPDDQQGLGQVAKEEQGNQVMQHSGLKETGKDSTLVAAKMNNQSNAEQPLPVDRNLSSIQPSEMKATQPLLEQESLHRSEEQRFVKQLQRIFQQGTMTQLKDGQVQFTLKLFPEHLGKLQIQFIQMGQKLTAQILADSSSTKELVERSLPQLRQSLVQQSISIEQIDVEDTNPHNQQDQKDQQSEQDRTNQDETEEPGNTASFSFKTLLEDLFQTRNVGESNDIDHE
ncbi:flagellar hook-length control protein FliK [Alkalicoccobacillus murimartini]|uniref:Flagellar hook-length control protein FliK n=1 Tax=Alkalicoccobacillus murimartini TaxID=171685 RepID=A0ABT9YFM3_9BACI|nr:flagellar hook-length control protein FliK [Alkalicoccobacillus murimartini]MDQ0206341.1 flagellar hook-length control protein FliK [Alkalicoccobacillus murimartini]